jgi:hypothetical protein
MYIYPNKGVEITIYIPSIALKMTQPFGLLLIPRWMKSTNGIMMRINTLRNSIMSTVRWMMEPNDEMKY